MWKFTPEHFVFKPERGCSKPKKPSCCLLLVSTSDVNRVMNISVVRVRWLDHT